MKNQKTKKDKSKQKNEEEKKKSRPATNDDEKEKTFDFGGLPNRDLKKNLGCG